MTNRVRRFIACPGCGKERECSTTEDRATESYFRVMALCVCRACEMDHHKAMDLCPESLTIDSDRARGIVGCGLTWHHKGPCEPIITEDDIVNEDAMKRIVEAEHGGDDDA